jgi:hypothetical protein
MTSKIKVDNITKVSDDSNIINKCGTTVTVGAASDGVRTGSNNLQASDGGNLISQCGATITLGASGDTITLASGASQSGFGRSGSVNWETTVKTGDFTAADGSGYFVNTTSGSVEVSLPAGSAGAIVAFADYTRNFGVSALQITPNGSDKIGGVAAPAFLDVNGQAGTFIFIDSTEGWINVQETSNSETGNPNLVATGGTVTTCGNNKIHTFTGPGTFEVVSISNTAAENTVGYMVVAGGGGSGPAHWSGGGGAGGYREGRNAPIDNFTASPLVANAPTNAVTVTATSFPITVGAGGAGTNGSPSVFSTITSAGGGWGGKPGSPSPTTNPQPGGSGAGNNPYCKPVSPVGAGNSPPVTPPQGNPGGTGLDGPTGLTGRAASGGGGGAGGTGGNAANITPTYPGSCSAGRGGAGGTGVSSSITGSSVTRAGGGAGSSYLTGEGGVGGSGGGGNGGVYNPIPGYSGPPVTPTAGGANTGGGAGSDSNFEGTDGGSGIVVIRYKYQ